MAIDAKYGEVILEHGLVEEDEPVVVFRATDKLLPQVLVFYHTLCSNSGSPKRHLDLIVENRDKIMAWQKEHGNRVPNSEASRDWMD